MSEKKLRPTKEGLKRYDDGIYKGGFPEEDKEMWTFCTCKKSCEPSCKGKCGCEACSLSYNDFLSGE